MAYNLQGMCIQSENLVGQVTTTARDGSRFDVAEFPSGEASAEGGSMRSTSSPSRNGGTPLLHPGDPDVAAASSPSQGAASWGISQIQCTWRCN